MSQKAPINRTKKFSIEEIEKHFGTRYLVHNEIKPTLLKSWDITKDKEYLINVGLNERLEKKYSEQIAAGYVAPLYIKWVNKMVEYGAFANADLERGDMVCEYTGILCEDSGDVDNLYLWDYPTFFFKTIPGKKRRKKTKFCIDAQEAGNIARFINHTTHQYQNVGVQIVPAQGFWHVVYVARRPIKKGQQFLTHYGVEYWRDRQIVPVPIKP
jgi:hypothetical protein